MAICQQFAVFLGTQYRFSSSVPFSCSTKEADIFIALCQRWPFPDLSGFFSCKDCVQWQQKVKTVDQAELQR